MPRLGFEETLAALMGRLGERVRISVFAPEGHPERPAAQVVDIEGVLTSGWDPDTLAANDVDDAGVFSIEGADRFGLYVLAADFSDAQIDGDVLLIHTGGVSVAVTPPEGVLGGGSAPTS